MDDYYYDEEEIDLLKLVSTNANDANQFILFDGSNDELYAINVSKIRELIIYKDVEILRNQSDNFIVGTGDIRGELTTIVNFDHWIGNKPDADDKYELIIVAAYGGHRLGIVVKSVENIITIDSEDMSDNSSANPKSTFVAKVEIYSESKMVTIFDSDMLLSDIFPDVEEKSDTQLDTLSYEITAKGYFMFADDSKYIRVMLERLCQKMQLNYEIYENGKELLAAVFKKRAEDISLIISDIEMPVMGGRELIDSIRKNSDYDSVNIIVHTNMSNDIMKEELLELGAQKIIGKVNIVSLAAAINELAK